MIPSTAIREFLEKPREDHRWLKNKSRKVVDQFLFNTFPTVRPHKILRIHQRVCLFLGLCYERFSFWLDMGTGKTLLALELLQYWWDQDKIRRALVFVLSDKAYSTWERQLKQYDISIPYIMLDGSSKDKWWQLSRFSHGLVFVHYPGALAMVHAGKKKLDEAELESLTNQVDAVVFDESTRIGHDSLTHAMCSWIAGVVPICYNLSGRPFGRDPTLLWRQQYVIDKGASLGELGQFRAAFFSKKKHRWGRGRYTTEFTFQTTKMKEMTRLAQHRSIIYRSDECIEFPPCTPLIEEVRLPEEAGAYYKRLVTQVMEAQGNYRAMKNAFLSMRQLSSGFLGFKDDETGAKAEIAFDQNPKLDRLLELIEEVPDDCSAVVFYEFTWSGRKISEQLRRLGLEHIWLWSGTKEPRKSLDQFTSGKKRILVVNNKIGNYSLDGLQIANYGFIHESPVSGIDRDQLNRRLVRQGQTRKVFLCDLVVRGTMDQRILDYHSQGQKLFDVLTENPAKVLRGK